MSTSQLEIREVKPRRWGLNLEGAIRSAFPGWSAKREHARLRLRQAELGHALLREAEIELRRGGYDGASKEAGQSEWMPGGGSADEDTLPDLEILRERSRDLIRNDPHANSIIQAHVDGIVGSGLTPQPLIDRDELGLTEDEARAYQKTVRRIFVERFWDQADVAGLLDMGQIQRLLVEQEFSNGEGWAITRARPEGRHYATAIQLIEADQVMTPPNKLADPNIREGVVISPEWGEHLSYWVKKTHPGDLTSTARPNPTDDFVQVPRLDDQGRTVVHHHYKVRRPGLTRGAPLLAPALSYFRDLKQYFRAELVAAKVAACFAVFISTEDPMGMAAASADLSKRSGKKEETLRPGLVKYLGLGNRVDTASPGRPNAQFGAFMEESLRSVGCSVRSPLEVTRCDFSKTTYTSGRMSIMMVRQVYALEQLRLAKICQQVYRRVLLEAFLRGEIRAPRFLERFDSYTRARWKGPAQTWVDPAKEVDATLNAISGNISTLADECAARNMHWEDVLEQRAIEQKRMKELGLSMERGEPVEQPVEPDEEEVPDVA